MGRRKLRIAWSVGCGVLCLLLVLLWVRSYWAADRCVVTTATRLLFASSHWGEAAVSIESLPRPPLPKTGFQSRAANRLRIFQNHGPADSRLRVKFPHLSLAIPTAAIGAVPWIRRYNIRTLLIAVTLFAAWLASIVTAN